MFCTHNYATTFPCGNYFLNEASKKSTRMDASSFPHQNLAKNTAAPVSFYPTWAQGLLRYRYRLYASIMCPPNVAAAAAEERPVLLTSKGMNMSSNQKSGNKQSGNQGGVQGGTPEQHAEAGRQSHKNDANRQSGNAGNASGGSNAGGASGGRSASSGSGSGTRGGTPEQHAEAGRQSHKNDGKK
jgi:hypothetical protein